MYPSKNFRRVQGVSLENCGTQGTHQRACEAFVKKVKIVFCGQEPPSGESPTTECGVNYRLLAVITEVAQ